MISGERSAMRQAALAERFVNRLHVYDDDGHEGITLRPHQPALLGELALWFGQTIDRPGRKILMPSPPNYGKSSLLAVISSMCGLGEAPSEDQPPLKGLTLTERRPAL